MPKEVSSDLSDKALKAAFATSDLQTICKAVDAKIIASGITTIAETARIDRTTLYRAFRLKAGPALQTMVAVLRCMDFRLTVEVKNRSRYSAINSLSTHLPVPAEIEIAAKLTGAFKEGDLESVIQHFRESLKLQENFAEFARKTIISREALYRAFKFPRIPRFSTTLSVLNAINLRFSVERL